MNIMFETDKRATWINRIKLATRAATLGITLAIASQAAVAGGFRLPDQDAFATARGEAFAATADNASAIYYNPAGIGQLQGSNFRGGVYSIWFRSFYDSPAASADSEAKIHPVPQLFYAYGCEDLPFSFGVGAYSPYGLSIKWPDNTPFRTTAIDGSLQYYTINPVVAWRVTPTLSLAAGLTLNYGKADLTTGVAAPGDRFNFTGDSTTAGFNLGMLWQVSSNVNIGVAYRSPTTIKMDGSTSSTYPFLAGSAETSFAFPQNLVGGISWRPTPEWNFEFNLDWTDWNRVNSLQIQSAIPLPPTVLNWKSSFYYEFGATHYFGNGWSVSAGYIYNENSMPDEFYNPLVADLNKQFLSAGAGYQGKHWSFDVAYQFGFGPDRTVTSTSNPAVNGTYSFISHAVSLSAGYKF
jgi:long-chain fatty acid transport protein